MLTVWGSNYGPLTVGGQWWRLLSSMFLHLGLLHLVLNMWVLWNVGRLAERLFGHGVFLLLYFFTGLVASLATVAWDASLNVVGSSGAIFGVVGAVLASVIHPGNRTPPAFIRSHCVSLLLFTMFNLLAGALQAGIANAAHVGGLVSGVLLGTIIAHPQHDNSESPDRVPRAAVAVGVAGCVLLLSLALDSGNWRPDGAHSTLLEITPMVHRRRSRQSSGLDVIACPGSEWRHQR